MSGTRKKKRKHPPRRIPTADKIKHGCFIDFEGFGKNKHRITPPPVLIGLLNEDDDGEFRQVVFTNAYEVAAKDPGVDHPVEFCDSRNTFLEGLVKERIEKPLFAFSEHELALIEKHVGHKITRRFRNVKTIATTWLNQPKQRDSYPKLNSKTLLSVAECMGITLPDKLPVNGITDRLREVREYSSSARKWSTAPESIREKWQEILEHNKSDVMSIRKMMMVMRGLDES
jgi:hypothetical protein